MPAKDEKYVLWFDDLGKDEVALVGGKSSSLGEMTQKTNVAVPYGFATTAAAYRHFIKQAKLDSKIADAMKELVDPNDTRTLQKVGKTLRTLVLESKMPKDLHDEIVAAYKQLAKKSGDPSPYVAIRSSATAEDLPDASFAGQQESYLNVSGGDQVSERVKECYASLFTDRAIFYRAQKGFDHMAIALSGSSSNDGILESSWSYVYAQRLERRRKPNPDRSGVWTRRICGAGNRHTRRILCE